MKTIITIICFFLNFAAQAEIHAEFIQDPAEQVFTGVQPNDVATSSFKPNVGVSTSSDTGGIYSVIGFNLICEGDTFDQIWSKGEGTAEKIFVLNAPQLTVNTYDNWPVGNKSCNIKWKAETAGSKSTTGGSINFTFNGLGFDVSIGLSTSEEPPDNRKQESASKIFQMIKDPAPSGSTGSSC